MSDPIVFYHNPLSRSRIVHAMLEEVGAPYEIKLVSFEKKEHKAAAFLAVNPMGKLPTIVHRGTVVTEAAAICAYLADAFPKAGLAPALEDPARGAYYRWFFFGAACFEPALVDRMLARPPVERKSTLGYGSYEDVISTLEDAVATGPYLLGDRFTAADVYLAAQVGWGLMTKSLDPRPSIVAYAARVSERPAFKKVVAETPALVERLKAQG